MAEMEMVERVAAAMKKRASEPVANLPHVNNVLVGSLGDVWAYLAAAAIEATREPTEAMIAAGECVVDNHDDPRDRLKFCAVAELWQAMNDAALSSQGEGVG